MESIRSGLTNNIIAAARRSPSEAFCGRLQYLSGTEEFLDQGTVTVLRLTDGKSEGSFYMGSLEVEEAWKLQISPIFDIKFRATPTHPRFLVIEAFLDIEEPIRPLPAPQQPAPKSSASKLPKESKRQNRSPVSRKINFLEQLLMEWEGLTIGRETEAVSGTVRAVSELNSVGNTNCFWIIISKSGMEYRVYFFGGQVHRWYQILWEKKNYRLEGVIRSRSSAEETPSGETVMFFGLDGDVWEIIPRWDQFNNVDKTDPAAKAQSIDSLSRLNKGARASILGTVLRVNIHISKKPVKGCTDWSFELADNRRFCVVLVKGPPFATLGIKEGDYLLLENLKVQEPLDVAQLCFGKQSRATWDPFYAGQALEDDCKTVRRELGTHRTPVTPPTTETNHAVTSKRIKDN